NTLFLGFCRLFHGTVRGGSSTDRPIERPTDRPVSVPLACFTPDLGRLLGRWFCGFFVRPSHSRLRFSPVFFAVLALPGRLGRSSDPNKRFRMEMHDFAAHAFNGSPHGTALPALVPAGQQSALTASFPERSRRDGQAVALLGREPLGFGKGGVG